MHLALAFLAATTSTTTKAKSKSSSSTEFLLFIAVLFFVVYFLFLRPRQQRAKRQQVEAKQLGIGDRVMSAGGIYGTVVAIDSDVVEVEVSPGVVLSFTKRAISAAATSGPAPPAGPAFGGGLFGGRPRTNNPAPSTNDHQPVDDEWSVHDSGGPEDSVADRPSDSDPESDH